ncbi:MAG TPA: twin-arginine translocation signal domain-containing protein [Rhizomicrobium sp.]|nr:twin-arginine translocation signal domain-containing protein [Rhizomicrobium sp.]
MGLFGNWSRRDLLKTSGAVAGVMAPLGVASAPAAAQGAPKLPAYHPNEQDNIFTHIGVRTLINGRGTYTIISGSRSLPEVKQAMFEASHYYVHLDEMMDGVGAELGKLMGAQWGIATNGAEAAICLATIACIAGANVEKCQALPYVKAKDQVIIPRYSRNPYDLGVRMAGAQIVEVETPVELRSKISSRTAMIYVMSGPEAETGPLNIATLCAIAKETGVPILVDAAAEEPLNPNPHISRGATLVCYSGGKCLRGPQSSGILLGDKGLCKAAYYQAAPHHAYGRALKCSKEESMGILAAVRQWYKRDHAGEQKMWLGWMQGIEARLKGLPSTSFEYLQPSDLSNKATRLRVKWDANVLKITGSELVAKLDAGSPRILIDGGSGRRPDQMASSVTIMPYMLDPGESEIIGNAIYAALTNPGHYDNPVLPSGAPASLAGTWAVTVEYLHGHGEQKLVVEQSGGTVNGMHLGELYSGKLQGQVHGDHVELHTVMEVPGNAIHWVFTGSAQGNRMSGTVNMGEYGGASFTAVRA